MNRGPVFALMAAGSLAVSVTALAAGEGGASLRVGAEYTTGDYGTSQRTRIWYLPLTVGYETARHRIALTVPYVVVRGPGTVVPSARGGAGGVRSGFAPIEDRSRSGIGDPLLAGAYNLVPEGTDNARLDLAGKIKFGSAERDKSLGTGEDDVGIQLDVERHFGANGVFGSVGYLFPGDPPGVHYRNAAYGTLGALHRFDRRVSAGFAFTAQEAIAAGAPSQAELNLFLSSDAGARRKVTGYVLKGLQDGSPDWGAGLMFKFGI